MSVVVFEKEKRKR